MNTKALTLLAAVGGLAYLGSRAKNNEGVSGLGGATLAQKLHAETKEKTSPRSAPKHLLVKSLPSLFPAGLFRVDASPPYFYGQETSVTGGKNNTFGGRRSPNFETAEGVEKWWANKPPEPVACLAVHNPVFVNGYRILGGGCGTTPPVRVWSTGKGKGVSKNVQHGPEFPSMEAAYQWAAQQPAGKYEQATVTTDVHGRHITLTATTPPGVLPVDPSYQPSVTPAPKSNVLPIAATAVGAAALIGAAVLFS